VITLTDAHDRAAVAAIAAMTAARRNGDIPAAHRWAELGRIALREANTPGGWGSHR